MTEPITAAIEFTHAAIKSWQAIDRAWKAVQSGPETLQRWETTSQSLLWTLPVFEKFLKKRREEARNPLELLHYEAIAGQLKNLSQELEKMERIILGVRNADGGDQTAQTLSHRVRLAVKLHWRKDEELLTWVYRHLSMLQWSMQLLRCLDDANMHDAQRVLGEVREQSSLFTKDEMAFDKWKTSAEGMTKYVAVQELGSTNEQSAGTEDAPEYPTTIRQDQLNWDDSEAISPEEMDARFRAALKYADRLEAADMTTIACSFQLQAIQIWDEMNESREFPLGFEDRFPFEERFIRLLLSSRVHSHFKTEALSRLKQQASEADRLPYSSEGSRLCDTWRKIGKISHEMDELKLAEKYLRLALDKGYLKMDLDRFKLEIRDTSRLLCQIYDASGHPENSDGLRAYLRRRLGVDPTLPSEEIRKAIDWCRQKGFQVEEENGQLTFPCPRNETGNTPLHEAARDLNVDTEIAPKLMNAEILSLRNRDGETALSVAVGESNTGVVEVLLRTVPSLVHALGPENSTPLHRCRDLEILNCLIWAMETPYRRGSATSINAGESPGSLTTDINSRDAYGRTALHLACKRGLPELVNRLLSAKADVNALCKIGQSPLLLTCMETKKQDKGEIVPILMQRGANLKCKDKLGNSVKRALQRNHSTSEIRNLLSPNATSTLEVRSRHWRRLSSSTMSSARSKDSASTASSSPPRLSLDIPDLELPFSLSMDSK